MAGNYKPSTTGGGYMFDNVDLADIVRNVCIVRKECLTPTGLYGIMGREWRKEVI